jgi:hypothetical protein
LSKTYSGSSVSLGVESEISRGVGSKEFPSGWISANGMGARVTREAEIRTSSSPTRMNRVCPSDLITRKGPSERSSSLELPSGLVDYLFRKDPGILTVPMAGDPRATINVLLVSALRIQQSLLRQWHEFLQSIDEPSLFLFRRCRANPRGCSRASDGGSLESTNSNVAKPIEAWIRELYPNVIAEVYSSQSD